MPIGSTNVYNTGDLILSTVSGSGTSFIETKIIAATSSFILFNSSGTLTSASLNSIVATTSSYVSGSTSIITNLTASNISASGTSSFGYVGIGTTVPSAKLEVANTGRILGVLRLHITPQTTFYDNTFAVGTDGGGANGFIYTSGTGGTFPLDTYGELILQSSPRTGYNNGISLVTGTTSPSVKLRISEVGNVGIGTTSPSYKLDVQRTSDGTIGYFRRIGATINPALGIYANESGNSVGLNTDYVGAVSPAIAFSIASSEKVRITNDGNVGIGTTTVNQKLSIYPGTTGGISLQDSGGDTRSYFFIDNTNPTYSTGIRTNNYYLDFDSSGGAQNAIRFYTGTSTIGTGTERMRIDAGGNVGIGTTSPKNKLHVAGLITLDSAIIYSKVNNVATNDPIRITIPFTKINTGGDFIVRVKAVAMTSNGSGVNYLDYVGYSGYTFNFNTNLTTIEKLGNVVVNSYVSASSGTAGNLYVELNGDDGYLQDSNWTIQTDIMGNSMYSTFDSGSITTFATSISEDILETSFNKVFGGNVGIGITSPTVRLHVSGSTIITGSLNVSANITCLSLTETSTEAVKYNIIPLTSQLDNVLKLKPVSFNYKTNDKHSIGLIAEDVSKVYPEFTSDNNDSISYGKITSVLIQSIKELKTIIDNQQKQIENLVDKLK